MDALVIAVESGKGGTGKTTTAALVGAAMAAAGKKTVLVELSPSLRSLDIATGISDAAVFDLEDVLSGRVAPIKAVVESPVYQGLSVIPAPYTGGQFTIDAVQELIARLRPHFDIMILDVAAGFDIAIATAAMLAHKIVLVETPDPVALRDGRALVDSLEGNVAQLRLVLNRVNPEALRQSAVLRDLDEAIDIVGVQLLGVVPESHVIQKAVTSGQALPPHSREGQIFSAIAQRLLGEEVPLVMR